jgi:tetratricopeptide (TPR) repeat protein
LGRVRLIVAAAALAAAATTVGLVLLTRDAPEARVDAEPPPLFLELGDRDDAEARALRRAGGLYDDGRLEAARAIFDRYDSPEARVGSAYARWPDSFERLEDVEDTAVGRLHLGIALAATGAERDSREELDEVERIAPDTPYAVRADDFLHPRTVPGLPFFLPSREATPALRKALDFQRLGRPLSARRAFDAAAAGSDDPELLTAAAVGRFDKDEPEAAFGRLGPLTRRFPKAQTVRFHLGLLLLWLAEVDAARPQLERARALDPASPLGRQAGELLERLGDGGTS